MKSEAVWTLEKEIWEYTLLEVCTQHVTGWFPAWPWRWMGLDGHLYHFKSESALLKCREKTIKQHKRIVKLALKEGKPVPLKVLADYPDLQKN